MVRWFILISHLKDLQCYSAPVVLDLFDLVAYLRPIKKQTGALCMGRQNNMLN